MKLVMYSIIFIFNIISFPVFSMQSITRPTSTLLVSKRFMHLNKAYSILDVNANQSLEEIKIKYLRLAKLHHPDNNPNKIEFAQEKMKEINQAYDAIKEYHQKKVNKNNFERNYEYEYEYEYEFKYKCEYIYEFNLSNWQKYAAAGILGLGSLYGIYKYFSPEDLYKEKINKVANILPPEIIKEYDLKLENTLNKLNINQKIKRKYDENSKQSIKYTIALIDLIKQAEIVPWMDSDYQPIRSEIIRLLGLGANPNLFVYSWKNYSYVLALFVSNNDHELLELLVKCGAELDSYSYHIMYSAKTPLMAYHLATRGAAIGNEKSFCEYFFPESK